MQFPNDNSSFEHDRPRAPSQSLVAWIVIAVLSGAAAYVVFYAVRVTLKTQQQLQAGREAEIRGHMEEMVAARLR